MFFAVLASQSDLPPGPNGSGQAVQSIWADFQANRRFSTHSGPSLMFSGWTGNLFGHGRGLTSPVLIGTLPQALLGGRKWPPVNLTSPVVVGTLPLVCFFQQQWPPMDLTSPVLVGTLPQARSFGENGHPWI